MNTHSQGLDHGSVLQTTRVRERVDQLVGELVVTAECSQGEGRGSGKDDVRAELDRRCGAFEGPWVRCAAGTTWTHVVLAALAVLASHTGRTRLERYSVTLLVGSYLGADCMIKSGHEARSISSRSLLKTVGTNQSERNQRTHVPGTWAAKREAFISSASEYRRIWGSLPCPKQSRRFGHDRGLFRKSRNIISHRT